MSDLRRAAALLDSKHLYLDDLARNILQETHPRDFTEAFAAKIVRNKIGMARRDGIELLGETAEMPFIVTFEEKKYGVAVAAEHLLPGRNNKSYLLRHAHKLVQWNERTASDGIIYCAPFLLNGKDERFIVEQNAPVAFVNLPYDRKSIDRRLYLFGPK